jgi:hypothetical protein
MGYKLGVIPNMGDVSQATRVQLGGVGGRRSAAPRRRKRARAAPKRTKAKRATKRRKRKMPRMVKGSAAAKRYMASIRRKKRR